MTESVWWYVLAGFLIGFILSTLWEWIYFRQRRMRIENRRIAELEATVRSLTLAGGAVVSATSSSATADYQGPGVFLENEGLQAETVAITYTTPATAPAQEVQQPSPAHLAHLAQLAYLTQPAQPAQPAPAQPAQQPPTAHLAHLAQLAYLTQPAQQVQPAPADSTQPLQTVSDRRNGFGYIDYTTHDQGVAAVVAAVIAVEHLTEEPDEQPATPAVTPLASAAPALNSFLPTTPKTASAYSNGSRAVPAAGVQPDIQRVSGELDGLLVSLQRLIETTDPLLDNTTGENTAGKNATPGPAVTGQSSPRNVSRGEVAVTRLMQSAQQFGRELGARYRRQ